MKLRGQVDVRQVLAVAGILLTPFGWLGGTIWSKYNAAEDFRREQAEHTRQLGELRSIPGRVERMEKMVEKMADVQTAQSQAHSKAQQEILGLLKGRR